MTLEERAEMYGHWSTAELALKARWKELQEAKLQVNAMREVVEAARAWKLKEKWPYLNAVRLATALDELEKVSEKRVGRFRCAGCGDFLKQEDVMAVTGGFAHERRHGMREEPMPCGPVHPVEEA